MSRTAVFALLFCAAAYPAGVQAQGIIDGIYSGEASMSQLGSGRTSVGTTYNCPPGGPFKILVKDSAFNLSWNGSIYAVAVKPDGTIDQAIGTGHIKGKIADGKLNAQAEGKLCHYSYKLSK